VFFIDALILWKSTASPECFV